MTAFTRLSLILRKCLATSVAVSVSASLGVMGFPNSARAYGTVSGTITGINVNASLGPYAYISIGGTKGSNPSCSTDPNFQYVLSLSNGQMFAMLLAARSAQMPVTLTGSGGCDLASNVETLWVVSY
jgi:hypothetical protein